MLLGQSVISPTQQGTSQTNFFFFSFFFFLGKGDSQRDVLVMLRITISVRFN